MNLKKRTHLNVVVTNRRTDIVDLWFNIQANITMILQQAITSRVSDWDRVVEFFSAHCRAVLLVL
jgi:hypothetical protein